MTQATRYVQRDQPPGVPPLELTGERTLPDVPEENYWYRRHLVVYEWIARRIAGLRVVDMACGEGYGSDVLARDGAASVVGVDANPEAHEHARLRYVRPNLRFERDLVETFDEPCDAIVFLQTIEHVRNPDEVLEHFKALVGPAGVVYVTTPNVLTLAPEGAEKSGNPWHVKEYRAEEFRALCEAHFSSVELLGPVPRAQAARPRAGDPARRLGRRPPRGWGSPSASTTASRRRSRCATSRCAVGPRTGATSIGRWTSSPSCARDSCRSSCTRTCPTSRASATWPFGRGVAVGGDRDDVPAARRRARPPRAGAADAVAHAGARRPARGAGHRRALPGASAAICACARTTLDADAADDHAGGRRAAPRAAASTWTPPTRSSARGGDVLGALAPHVSWTSSATHAVLPLLATRAGVRLQVRTGIEAHRARFGADWRGGFWLPECAHAPWLDPLLEEAGVHATCVDLTDVLAARRRSCARCAARPGRCWCRSTARRSSCVWGDGGYPAAGAYRDSHHLTRYHHKPWANDGTVYDPARAAAQVRARRGRLRGARARARWRAAGCACARWTPSCWATGGTRASPWLEAVLEEARRARASSSRRWTTRWRRIEPVAAPAELPVTTWGTPRDLWTWSGPQVADLAFAARRAELDVVAAGAPRGHARAARAAGAAEQRLGVHGQPRPGRPVPARALRRPPPRAGRRAGAPATTDRCGHAPWGAGALLRPVRAERAARRGRPSARTR